MNAPLHTAVAATAFPSALETPDFGAPATYIGGQVMLFQGDYLDRLERVATMMSKAGSAIPKHLRGNVGACFSVLLIATRCNMDPFGVARKTWEGPDGTLKFEGQLVIALINNSGLLQDRLRWEYFGDWTKILGKFEWRETKKKDDRGNLRTDENGNVKKYISRTWADADEKGLGVRCIAHLKGETEPRITELLMAQAVTRNSTLWVEDPRQQIGYLSGARWGRLHAPEATMGIYLPEEVFTDAPKDMGHVQDVTVPQELLQRAEAEAAKGTAAYSTFWRACTHLERAQLDEQSDNHERLKKVAVQADEKRTVTSGASAPRPPAGLAAAPAATPAAAPAPASAPASSAPAPASTGSDEEPKKTYADVIELMKNAADPIGVEIAAEWIGQLEDAQQRQDAEKFRDDRIAELQGGK